MRTLLVATVVVAVLAGDTLLAFADVTVNERFIQTGLTITNPCDPGDGVIALTVEGHRVRREMPDGTVIEHFNFHGNGVSATGTEYVINQTQVRMIDGSAFTAEFYIRRVSKGATDNALIDQTITGPPPVVVVFEPKCVG